MPSRQWEYFMDNFFGDPYMMWHDGIDPKSVCLLEGAERDQAEAMLIESLETGSHYAAMGLRELRSEKAIPVMKRLLAHVSADLKIEIAIALNTIEKTTEYNSHIIEVLQQYPSPYVRLNAAQKLRQFPTLEVILALFEAVSDVDYLVRNHACESLLYIHGLKPSISEHREIFSLIITEFDSQDDSSIKSAMEKYTKAADMLRLLFK
ncbi:HEAT repeat domain-containing protein [Candidatus Thorarchaeota archaeon]|nr:MAG: HEAT repeat domain-containing protein [Candidatus Thorarchaeota archaeon]